MLKRDNGNYIAIKHIYNESAYLIDGHGAAFNTNDQSDLHPRTWAPSQYKDGLCGYGDFHVKDKPVVKPSCLLYPDARDKRRVSEIDLSQPRYETVL